MNSKNFTPEETIYCPLCRNPETQMMECKIDYGVVTADTSFNMMPHQYRGGSDRVKVKKFCRECNVMFTMEFER